MLTLFHAPRSRSSRFVWLLEEIGEPYDIEYVAIAGREGRDPQNPHPHGKVPARLPAAVRGYLQEQRIAFTEPFAGLLEVSL